MVAEPPNTYEIEPINGYCVMSCSASKSFECNVGKAIADYNMIIENRRYRSGCVAFGWQGFTVGVAAS